MKHVSGLVLLIFMSQFVFAKKLGPYVGVSFGVTDVGVATRDINDVNFKGGRLTFSGKNLKVRNNGASPSANGDTPLTKGDQRGQGFNIHLGYQITQNIGFEYRYNKFGDAEYSDGNNKAFNKEYSMDVVSLFSIPVATNWDLRGHAGVTWLNSSLSIDGGMQSPGNIASFSVADGIKDASVDVVSFLYGAGLAYHWNEKTDLILDHVRYYGQDKIDGASYIHLGVSVHFSSIAG